MPEKPDLEHPSKRPNGLAKNTLLASLLVGVLAVGNHAADTIQVPLNDQPNAPMVPLKVRVKCAIADILEGRRTTNEPTQPKPEKKEDEKKDDQEEDTPRHRSNQPPVLNDKEVYFG
jgi:hypothetical protein